jgi:hypothetical protein
MRSHFAAFALGTICLTACSSTSSNPVTVAPQTSYALAHQIPTAKKPVCAKSECIYVVNPTVNCTGSICAGSITVYPANANGNVAPVQEIVGTNTGLCGPWGVAVDKMHNIYAAINNDGYRCVPSITVYPVGSNGNVTPSRTISGTNTQLCSPTGITVNSKYQIYVDDAPGNANCYALRVFAAGANGNVAPISTIVGKNTSLNSPVGVSLYGKYVYVLNQGNVPNMGTSTALLSFGLKSSGNVPPATDVTGGNAFPSPSYADGVAVSSASSNRGIAYVASHNSFVDQWGCPQYSSSGGGQVLGFPYGANGNVAPSVNISGNNTGLLSPCSDAVDIAGKIYVTDSAANAIFVFAANANGNVAPIQIIQGANTQLNAPEGIAVL